MARPKVFRAVPATVAVFVALLAHPGLTQIGHAGTIPDDMLRGLRYRLVGPFRGGRVNTVAGIPGDPTTYYFGTPGGGVWKTTDAGATWNPIFDGQAVAAIGSLAVSSSDPNVVYVGTGDPHIRGNVSHGDGVYKSTDAGGSWKKKGLTDTRHIGKVIVHPRDPDLVYVAAVGHFYGENDERGVFRSRDGGGTWEKVLFVDSKTGAVDVAFDPNNPRILFATTWQIVRMPWDFVSGGPGSGLHRSTDGGDTWTKLEGNGLPDVVLGKLGVAVSPADSGRVYAVVEAADEKGGLYRSDDGGKTWAHVNGNHHLTQRAWYFMKVIPDPKNRDVLYVMNINFMKSIDGGANFEIVDQYHVDNMTLWIDPEDSMRMINGNDGGANISVNGGQTWSRSDDNQPLGQFYRVITDNQFPYHIYGGQQDWGTLAIASRGAGVGIVRTDWYPVGGCEMGWAAPDPRDANIVYAGCTDGGISRYDHRTKRNQSIEPWPETNIGHGAADAKYRFQWTAPILISPHDPTVLYMASNVLFRSTDEGMSWEVITPDLSRNDKSKQLPAGGPITKDNVGTEVYGTIYALDESPVQKGLLWAGTDDGLVQLSRDGGENWSNVTPANLPEWSRVGMIDASPHEPGAAYLAIDRHELDDYKPYIYKTADFGATWQVVGKGIPDGTFVRVVREDPVRRGLLYAGTETGIYLSLDDGENWQTLQLNLPVSPVWDLVVKDNDLVVATHGRAFWVLDDLGPLRTIDEKLAAAPVHLFSPSPAYRVRGAFGRQRLPHGENPPGAIIYYHLGSEARGPESEVKLSILDAAGNLVRTFSSEPADGEANPFETSSPVGTDKGLNRFSWDLLYPGPRFIPEHILFMHPPPAPPVGPLALPGQYTVKLEARGQTVTAPLELEPDPSVSAPERELRKQFELQNKMVEALSIVTDAVLDIREAGDQVTALQRRAESLNADRVAAAAADLADKLDSIEKALIEPRMQTGGNTSGAGGDAFNYPTKLDNKLSVLIGIVANSDRAPTRQSYEAYESLWSRIQTQFDNFDEVVSNEIPALNRLADEQGVPAVVPVEVPGETPESY